MLLRVKSLSSKRERQGVKERGESKGERVRERERERERERYEHSVEFKGN